MIFKKGKQFHIAWHGPDDQSTGYGSSSARILKALGNAGKVMTYPRPMDDGSPGIVEEDCAVGVAYSAAFMDSMDKLSNPYRILYTMFEADRWPKDWVRVCDTANQVWVPSGFCRETLVDSGCKAPVYVVPLGIDPDQYYPGDPFVEKEGVFTFGYAGAWQMRKGTDLLIKAFREEFGGSDDVRLCIKAWNMLSSQIPNDSRIIVEDGIWSVADMRKFYQSLDLFVMPTRGEGFGLTPLEAMACGCPVAVTDWGGCKDYLGDHALRIAVDRLESCNGYHGSEGSWARPSVHSIRYCMRWAYENRKQCAELGAKGLHYVLNNWQYSVTADRIAALLKDTVNPKERVSLKAKDVVVWTGSPRNVTVGRLGGFVRGVPKELTPEQIASLRNDSRFRVEKRYERVEE